MQLGGLGRLCGCSTLQLASTNLVKVIALEDLKLAYSLVSVDILLPLKYVVDESHQKKFKTICCQVIWLTVT